MDFTPFRTRSEHSPSSSLLTQVRCRVAGCRCACFTHVPGRGGTHIRCGCKHQHHEHRTADGRSGACSSCGPGGCSKFHSDWRCGCGETYDSHAMAFETVAERARDGRATEQNLGGWSQEKSHLDAACGGVTSIISPSILTTLPIHPTLPHPTPTQHHATPYHATPSHATSSHGPITHQIDQIQPDSVPDPIIPPSPSPATPPHVLSYHTR